MKLKEECGVVGVLTRDKVQASFIAYRGLLLYSIEDRKVQGLQFLMVKK